MEPSSFHHIQEIITNESRYFANDYQGEHSNPNILTSIGTLPILIAAPHAVQHLRSTRIKKAEAMTGTIATQIAARCGSHSLILAKSTDEDPNYDELGSFKSALSQHVKQHNIKLVINLHGMSELHGYDIVLGSGLGHTVNHQTEILTTTSASFAKSGINNILIDDPNLFPATNQHNLSQYSWRKLNTLSFQIEISYGYRNPVQYSDKYIQLIEGFSRATKQLASLV